MKPSFLFLCSLLALSLHAQASSLTFRLNMEPETLDWNRAHTPAETHILMNLMEGLVTFDGKLKVVPKLAKSWKVSPDGLTYTFELRRGVKWSDGEELKAEHFVLSWKRLLSPLTAAAYAYMLFDLVGAEDFFKGKNKDFASVGVKAPNPYTLVVKLRKPVAHWIQIPTFWVTFPIRQDLIDRFGSQWARPGAMQTVGPYVLVTHDHDSRIVMKKNPHYYGKTGNIQELVGLIIKDDAAALTLFESGKLDLMTGLPLTELARLNKKPGKDFDLQRFPYLKTVSLGFELKRFPSSSPHVRRAIAMAIDKSKFAELLHGGQQAATSFVHPNIPFAAKRVGQPYHPINAKLELKAGGIDTSTPLNIDLAISNDESSMTMAQFVQAELKKNLNINVNIQSFDHKTYRAQLDLHAYPMFKSTWGADYPDPDNFLSVYLSDSGNNRSGWKSAEYDDLVLKARYSRSPAERARIYQSLDSTLVDKDVVLVPLYYEPLTALVRRKVKGLVLNPLNYLIFEQSRID